MVGSPTPGYKNQYNEWSVDVYVDEETQIKLVEEGLKARIKDKGDGPYISFKRKEFKQDGSPNQPVRVVDHHGHPWDQTKKIGNGSVVNVNFAINEYGKNEKTANILAMQVWDLVEFNGGEFPVKTENWEEE